MNPEKLVPLLFDLGLKSVIVIVAAMLASTLFRRASAANRHVIWMAMLGTLLLLPLTELTHPHWTFFWQRAVKKSPTLAPLPQVAPGAQLPALPLKAVMAAKPEESHSALARLAAPGAMVWICGAALLLLQGVAASWKLRRLVEGSAEISDARLLALAEEAGREIGAHWILRQSEVSRAPLVFGMWRPVILMPVEARNWTDEGLRAAFLHEFGHVRRRDCLTRVLMDIACAIYWVNPLVWIAARQMRISQEQACDDIVLTAGVSPTGYASQMVEIVRSLAKERFRSRRALAMAQPSTLETRIRAIVDAGCDRRPLSRPALVGGTVAILAALAFCGEARLRGADGTGSGPNAPQGQTDAKDPANSGGASPTTGAGTKTGGVSDKAIAARSPEENQVVATVNDQQITAADVTLAITRASDRTSAEARKTTLEKVIDNALLVQYFRKMKYEIPAYFIDDRVGTIVREEFGGDEAKFEAALAKQGYTLEKFKQVEEEKIISQELRKLFSKTAIGPVEKKKAVDAWLAEARAKAAITYH